MPHPLFQGQKKDFCGKQKITPSGYCTDKRDKRDLHYLDIIEINTADFDCDIDDGSDSPATTDKEIPTQPASYL